MSFSDLLFIFRFLPVFLILYYLVPGMLRRYLLLGASLLFYALGDIRFFMLLIAATLANYVIGKEVYYRRKSSFILILLLDTALLAGFKSLGAFAGSVFIPVGISFYVFKMISYQSDLYRGKMVDAPSAIDAATYFSMFPQMISGPIMRFADYADTGADRDVMVDPFHLTRREYMPRLEEGAFYFISGLALKVILADHLAMCWNAIGTIGYAHLSTPLAWIGVLCYSLNLYFDFWGYSLMASGICLALGFPFIENFHHPYAAGSVTDFYRCWHMTLGSWFRDYIYIPLGGSRKGGFRTFFNLLVVWLLTALWHGFSLNFLIWGMTLFVLIVWEKYVLSRVRILHAVLSRFHVLVLVPLTWIPFALGKTTHLIGYFHRLFPFARIPANVFEYDYVEILRNYTVFFLAGIVLLIPQVFETLKYNRKHPVVVILLLALFWVSVYSLVGSAGNPFMYFQF